MLNQNHPILNTIDTYIEPVLKRVLQFQKFGVCCGKVELNLIMSSCGKSKGDRFNLSIPYAGQTLSWNVLFDSQYPELGPDFSFGDELFLLDPDVDILATDVPSLVKWDPMDPDSLLTVIIELVLTYKKYQIDQLAKHGQRLQLEYYKLINETEVCTEDVEVILLPSTIKPKEARFLIRMAMDFSKLPARSSRPHNDAAMLLVTFIGPEWTRKIPQLFLSKSLEEAFGGSTALHIPPFPPEKYLMSYVLEVKKFMKEKINFLALCCDRKKSFISSLLLLQHGSVIEYDAIEFTQISILMEHRDFYFMIHFHLPARFPKEQPQITLQSIYHMTSQGKLYSELVEDVPYSPRWEPIQMVTRALSHIIDNEVQKFQANSVRNSHF
ncbi:BRISC and BRCA1-A complex member 2-like [Orussus abietinus]|uniref:BRISC and BRCA1-A complex member 2-like n=1 Tax=Orussus abietinus TaxID=222816 RepID=UPI000626C5D6|nr:BRISC and BRCA1-A complex member 2-like [Orussus abietinus]